MGELILGFLGMTFIVILVLFNILCILTGYELIKYYLIDFKEFKQDLKERRLKQ